jgi:TonB family protein
MYLDLEDFRPDTPRVPQAISIREAVLLSLLAHALGVIAYLVAPEPRPAENFAVVPTAQQEPVRFVQMMPLVERPAPPRPNAEQSDLDRRAAAPEAAPKPENAAPFSRGNTSDKVIGGPDERPAGPDTPVTEPTTRTVVPDVAAKVGAQPPPDPTAGRPATGGLGASLRNLQQFLQNQNYDNQTGSLGEQQAADIQFDSKGVEFGPWLRRFVAQVKRNWYVPQAAMALRGRVVIQFYVLRNGTITDLKIVQPSAIDSFTTAAFNSLKLSNPTMPLPPEYPDDKAFFTVTFHYNEGIDR